MINKNALDKLRREKKKSFFAFFLAMIAVLGSEKTI